ncbi:M24 family metallopeptidase [Thermoflavimicrobium dichotomicum]|uniref:Xaa-Pro aminopeptidase n=1 Tax=Thermoflavimicrobium dichotomicum TaxID=46223 RepID=A0A1I3QBQ2_9BACL|nr:Xaa-Pro peptidase family protein [Thermoflavimicrobium dichotomicum]SFJ31724.1 Xaa-Pro aminopeptidase [Thermoflavimicrobium dichotomicum]
MEKRLKRLRAQMEQNGLEAILITRAPNRRYITGFTGSAGTVLVTANEAILFVDTRYTVQAKQQASSFKVIEYKRHMDLIPTIAQECRRLDVSNLAVEAEDLSYAQFNRLKDGCKGIQLTPTSFFVDKLRMIKDQEEIAIIRQAASIADQAFARILEEIRPGMTEKQVATRLEFLLREFGATSSSFDMIIASGKRSALPHGVASDKKLEKGDLVTLDFGALYNGYVSDITRTIMLGKPNDKQKEIYDTVLEAENRGIRAIQPGVSGVEVDAAARNYIISQGYGDYFGHGTGHGIGLEVHEGPYLSTQSEDTLVPGMIVTVEPGIYIPDFGGVRIEDDVLVTESGYEVLTHSKKELIVID